ncbi:XRE family transcriptional regulator [Neolewinella antarctica]|uniref:Nucleotidyltransferase/transcriptional regulator with XRE-family HTH domain n=1 Tax=Neolewinella antarctica TaxID=442734 RepID=A0ABX0XG34_9BACT|nr:XRE family transcriptional regulator [Neolewinella antarctica]NJC28182.1 putative nucleotidyltransferase/transcriptional regulator with XRE-family HTH domain [Neolewinella antarctica]
MQTTLDHPRIAGKVLRKLRKDAALSQLTLGERYGRSGQFISRVERGQRPLNASELNSFLQSLGVPLKTFSALYDPLCLLQSLTDHSVENDKNQLNLKRVSSKNKRREPRNAILKQLRQYFTTQPVTEAFLFGSVARSEHTSESDIDIYLTFNQIAKVSLFDLSRMKLELEDLTGREVDLVVKGSEHGFLKQSLEADKISVYG